MNSKILSSVLISVSLVSYAALLGIFGTLTIYKNVFFI
jgi:hypothetical protein